MTDKDQVKPYHAKGTGQEAADAVADVLAHAKEREAAAKDAEKKSAPKGQPKWMLPLAMNLGVLAVYFLVAQPRWLEINPIQPPPAEEQIEMVRAGMWSAGNRVVSFQINNGRLPATLAEANVPPAYADAIDYQVIGENYLLISIVGDQTITYDSAVQTLNEWNPDILLPG